jgi:hypothetical protein
MTSPTPSASDAFMIVKDYLRPDQDGDIPVLVCDLCGCCVELPEKHRTWHASLAPAPDHR